MILTRGDKKTLYHRALNDDKGIIDLTGLEICYELKETQNDPSNVLEKNSSDSSEIEIVNAELGLFNVYLTDMDTTELDKDIYFVNITIGTDDVIKDVIKVRPYK